MSEPKAQHIIKVKGPCVILAGAGTGKTYNIVEKIKYILENKIYPAERIVCLTFSNEAVNSLRSRILHTIHDDKEPLIRTFHSFCADLLRKHARKIGLNEGFKILLPDDAKIMLHKNLKIKPIYCHKYTEAISTAKDLGISIEDLESFLEKARSGLSDKEIEAKFNELSFKLHTLHVDKDSKLKDSQEKELIKKQLNKLEKIIKTSKLVKTWRAYEKLKEKQNLLDYSDLNKHALVLLNKNPEISKDFDYVVIDEFQDTNKLQCDLLEKICPSKNITIVGDLNQSIYRFRGAYKENLNNFKQAFGIEKQDIFNLDKSFRSTNKILKVAHQLISQNYKNKDESFPVYNAFDEEGEKVQVFELKNSKEEVRKILEIIKQEISSGTPQEEICVMFRTHHQAKLLKTALDNEKIPYTAINKKSLLKTKQVKITKAYLSILNRIQNKASGGEHAWWDLIYNIDVPTEDIATITEFIKKNKQEPNFNAKLLNSIGNLKLTEEGKIKIHLIIGKIKKLIPLAKEPITELIESIYREANLYPENLSEENHKEDILVLQKFREMVKEFSDTNSPKISDLIYHLDIINALGIQIEAPNLEDGGIRIMTQHATKGLEYKTVIVSNMVQRKFPIEKANNSLLPSQVSPELKPLITKSSGESEEIIDSYEKQNQLLEERRLCYVAFTRAKQKLIITYAREYGNRKFYPSQFLEEIAYKENPEISFSIDLEEKYKTPQNLEIKPQTPKSPREDIIFSPSALQTFDSCQKKYEYKYLYRMPEPVSVSLEEMKLGSFLHHVFEKGVNLSYKTEKEFLDLARKIHMEEKWNSIEISEALPIIKVFFHRNKEKYSLKSLTEKKLYTTLDGFKFMGVADRIDFSSKGLEIIDYKTGNASVRPKYRNWQLGFYALASERLGTPWKLTLDMLKKETPIEFVIDANGNAKEIHSSRTFFNLQEVKQEMVSVAQAIKDCIKNGFRACSPEKNCPFCNEYVWEN